MPNLMHIDYALLAGSLNRFRQAMSLVEFQQLVAANWGKKESEMFAKKADKGEK